MKIIRKSKSISGPARKRKTFPAVVRELAEKDAANAKVIIYEKHGVKNKYIDQIPILDAVDVAGDIEAALGSQYGGGEYQLSLVNSDSELVESYQFSISGLPKGRESPGEDTGGSNRALKGRGLQDELLLRAFDASIARQASSGEEFEKGLRVAKELRGDDSAMKQVQIDFMNAAMQNAMNPKETSIEEHLRVFQLFREIQPNLQPEDPLNTIIASALPLIGQFVQAKMGSGGAQVNAAQLQQVQQYLKSQGIDLAALQQDAQTQSAAPESAMTAVPPPGEVTQPSQVQEVQTGQKEVTEQPDIIMPMIDQLRLNILANASPKQLALQILDLVETAELWTPDNPPPILKGLVNQRDPVRLLHELNRFFGAIPELARNKEFQEQITTELINLVTIPLDQEQPDQNNEVNEKDATQEESPTDPL